MERLRIYINLDANSNGNGSQKMWGQKEISERASKLKVFPPQPPKGQRPVKITFQFIKRKQREKGQKEKKKKYLEEGK